MRASKLTARLKRPSREKSAAAAAAVVAAIATAATVSLVILANQWNLPMRQLQRRSIPSLQPISLRRNQLPLLNLYQRQWKLLLLSRLLQKPCPLLLANCQWL